ncbi:hypothetical protein [Caminibacter sp.]
MKIKLNKPNIKIPKITIYGIDVIKNLGFFALYIIITLLAITLIIAPSIKKFKQTQKKYFEAKYEFNMVNNQYNKTLNELKMLKKENAKILNAFRRDFNINNFKNFASQFMEITSIEKNGTKPFKKDFLTTIYFVKSKINSPKDFYDFIDALKNYKYIVKVYFPINFQKEGKKILLTLKLEHYRLKNSKALKAEEKAH